MKDNKKERRVDNLDIKAFVKKVFQESSWLMTKLAASPEDEGECFVDIARSISIKRLNELYGYLVDDRIVERLNNEIDEFNGIGQIENILKLSDMLHKKMNKGTLIIPRLTVGNSLLLFLLEITNVNPLPRHHYCPKCHTFHWAHNLKRIIGAKPQRKTGLYPDSQHLPRNVPMAIRDSFLYLLHTKAGIRQSAAAASVAQYPRT